MADTLACGQRHGRQSREDGWNEDVGDSQLIRVRLTEIGIESIGESDGSTMRVWLHPPPSNRVMLERRGSMAPAISLWWAAKKWWVTG